jgi:hypothetical protein
MIAVLDRRRIGAEKRRRHRNLSLHVREIE